MTPNPTSPGTSRHAVGQCENCGYVTGDSVDYRFPNPAVCKECGATLSSCTVADEETIAALEAK